MEAEIRSKIVSALVKYDTRQSRSKYHNVYAFSLYLEALDYAERLVKKGVDLESALRHVFSDRVLNAVLKASGFRVGAK